MTHLIYFFLPCKRWSINFFPQRRGKFSFVFNEWSIKYRDLMAQPSAIWSRGRWRLVEGDVCCEAKAWFIPQHVEKFVSPSNNRWDRKSRGGGGKGGGNCSLPPILTLWFPQGRELITPPNQIIAVESTILILPRYLGKHLSALHRGENQLLKKKTKQKLKNNIY